MNINFGLFPLIEGVATTGPDGKRLKGPAKSLARKQALTARAKAEMERWVSAPELAPA
jgi:methylenetetrahydrofolate--tRNA-(uracil-5-)-methyltransferase